MKKNYVSPQSVEANIEVAPLLLETSSKYGNGKLPAEEAWTKERRGEWGDLWIE